MWVVPYAALFILPLLWALIRQHWPRGEGAAIATIGVTLTCFIGLRFKVGGDWNSYILMYGRAADEFWLNGLVTTDPLYGLLNVAASRLGLGFGFVNLTAAALLVFGLLLWVRRQESPPAALIPALAFVLPVFALNASRQAACIGLLMFALTMVGRKSNRVAAAAFVVAFGLHWTAALLLPLGAIVLLKWRPKTRLIVAGWIIAGLTAAGLAAFPAVVGDLGALPKSNGVFLRLAPALGAAILGFAYLSKLEPADDLRVAVAYLIGLTLFSALTMFVSWGVADRISVFSLPLQIVVLGNISRLLAKRVAQRAAVVLAFSGAAALFGLWVSVSPYAECMRPYRWYPDEPISLLSQDPSDLLDLTAEC